MTYYAKYLSTFVKVILVKYDEDVKKHLGKKYSMFDPIDDIKLLNLPFKPDIIEESPNFLLTKIDYAQYRKKTDKFFFNAFYMFGKKIINVIPNVTSKDKMNRKSITDKELSTLKIPPLPKSDITNYIDENFKDNPGNTKDFIYPTTHKTAKKWLTYFITHKFKNFGQYQDFINKDNEYMFHSILSSSINIGLINPLDIIEIIEKHKTKIPINSYEGYIRQLFWREYQRYTYIYLYSKNRRHNYFENNKRLSKKWYTGETGIDPVDNCIIQGFKTGYLHHISRLMIMGNYMNLVRISPHQGFKWFMEFACDSYDWVMCQNIYGMAFFSDNGATMRRPYISSSNYILKMSNYKRGDWCDKWDMAYRNFIADNKKKLKKYRYYIRGV
jgi:deoxyribodipyrimidine photolyase-related protein